MGGAGSGRHPDPVRQLAQVKTPIATNAQDNFFLPNLSGMSRHIEAGRIFPTGGIIMWSGNIASIPSGWALCDGNNGTPDLRDRMIAGASIDQSGVAKTLITGSYLQSGGAANHSHSTTTQLGAACCDFDFVEVIAQASNVPPFYALAFIMKL